MASTNSGHEREEQKRLMEERTRQLKERVRSEAFRDKERIRKVGILRDILFALAMILVFTSGFIFYLHNYTFTTYAVDSEMETGADYASRIVEFKNGVILLGSDSLSYAEKDAIRWTAKLNVTDPIITVNGDYFSVYDQGSYYIYICDVTGIISTIKVSRVVYATDISASGVSAVLTESNDASYISYFDRFGNRLSVEVKTLLNATGFPLDISISPNGQLLSVVYYSTVNGIGESRATIYDFEKGKPENSYVIYTDDSAYLTDTLYVESRFLDDSHLVLVGDNKLTFLERQNGGFSETHIEETSQVLSVFAEKNYFGLVKEENGVRVCQIFDILGKETASFEVPYAYSNILTEDEDILFVNGADLYLYNTAGRLRYEGTLPEAPDGIILNDHHKLTLSFNGTIQKITLK